MTTRTRLVRSSTRRRRAAWSRSVLAVAAVTGVIELLRRWCRCSASACSTSSRCSRSPSCGARLRGRRRRREHARVQLVLPAADPHVHARRLARTGSRWRSSCRPRWSSASWPRGRAAARPSRSSWRGSPRRCSPAARSRGELERIAAEVARGLQVDRARIELGRPDAEGEGAYPLVAGGRRVGAIQLEGPAAAAPRLGGGCSGARVAARRRRSTASSWSARRSRPRRSGGRRDEDGAAARGQPRPAHAADGDLDRRRAARSARPRARRRRTGSCWRRSGRCHRPDLVGDLSTSRASRPAPLRPEPELCPLDDLVVGALDELGRAPAGSRSRCRTTRRRCASTRARSGACS